MKYDFISVMDRRGKDALAVDGIGKTVWGYEPALPEEGFDIIPMWVADMNFPTAPAITEAISERLSHPAFGYFEPRKEYFDSVISWQERRNGVRNLTPEAIGYENGVLGGVLSALNTFCSRGDSVLLHSPTYIGFSGALKNNGFRMVFSPLKQDDGGVWRMDLADMEKKIRQEHIHAFLFCSPHNPTGRVWDPEELSGLSALLEKYEVRIVSDEIWSDLILRDKPHIPFQSVSAYTRKNTVALYAPSKTFNLAGLIGSYHIIYDRVLRERVEKESSLCSYNEMNVLSMHALIGAYSHGGEEWLEELLAVLRGNTDYAAGFLQSELDGVRVSKPEGTYMLFADCGEYCERTGRSLDDIEHAAWDKGVALQDGRIFRGKSHLRINLALPRSRVEEAFDRLKKYVFV